MKFPIRCSLAILTTLLLHSGTAWALEKVPVSVDNFSRAETDVTMAAYVKEDALGKFMHARTPPSVDNQKVVRMNRDTLYSIGVFDLDAGSV